MVSKVMTVEASADEKQVYYCLSSGGRGGGGGGALCQPSSDKTGLLCANISISKGHVLKSWVVK